MKHQIKALVPEIDFGILANIYTKRELGFTCHLERIAKKTKFEIGLHTEIFVLDKKLVLIK